MAFIEFDVRRPNIRFDASQYSERRTVRLTTEEKELRNLDGLAGFSVIDENSPKDEKGHLYYSPEWKDQFHGRPASYSVFLLLTPEEHGRLVNLVQTGVPLTKLSIDAGEGVKYGWEPDGTGKDWDNAQFQKVPVVGFNLKFGADDDALDDDAEPSEGILDEAAAPDTFKRDALAKLTDLDTRLVWILIGVGLLIVAAIFRH
jgi:hypothetical protein